MKPRFLSFGWMLAALVASPTWGQTITPTPRPGAVLWTKTVTNMQSGSALYLTADERSVVTAQFNGRAYTPLSVDLSTQGLGTLGDPERLAGKLVTRWINRNGSTRGWWVDFKNQRCALFQRHVQNGAQAMVSVN